MISNMKSTRFVEPFEELVNCWETKLSSVTEVLEGILQVQKKWLYLENIFQGDDIRKQMRDKVKEFDKATNSKLQILLKKLVFKKIFNSFSIHSFGNERMCNSS